eukprot:TRINITY_DN4709_c0_g1_i2.p2 TRINITY_DN4709_c0_g1~~TRINITY_DN4709_c0_g1_i2.p2  ORF type:complete len:443 (+),score=92.70 TRINITY_DN4709_c0_g1_i2:836-2164(+)
MAKYNPQPFLSRGGIGQNELDNLMAAVYGDLKGAGGAGKLPQRDSSTDDDLLQSMAKRLKQAETINLEFRRELATKDKELLKLKRQAEQNDEVEVLKIQNSKLALQVIEMTQYLKEQGLQWVGSGRVSPLVQNGSASPSPATSPKAQRDENGKGEKIEKKLSLLGDGDDTFQWQTTVVTHSPPSPPKEGDIYFSVKRFMERVAELNLIAGEKVIVAEERLADGRAVSRLKDPDAVEVVLYSDGICVDRGIFRPYNWSLCRAFVDDVLDGYFPYEYHEKYPAGMLLKAVDKTSTPKPSETSTQVQGLEGCEGYRVVSKETFLNKLPKQVITAAGKVVNPRENVKKVLAGDAGEVEDIEEGTEQGTVTLQVRIVGGGKVVAKLHPTSTIGEVRAIVSKHLKAPHAHKTFELLTAYPRITFTDDSQTLEGANLVPNAALLMRIID